MKKCFIIFLLLNCFSFKHPFYLSVTELKYNAGEKVMEGSVKIFLNDLEDALSKMHHKTIDLMNVQDSAKTKQLLAEYLLKRLSLNINGQSKTFNFLGFEKEQEVIWLYVEWKDCGEAKQLKIENSILYDYLKSQTNIVHVDINGIKRSSKVNCPEKELVFEF